MKTSPYSVAYIAVILFLIMAAMSCLGIFLSDGPKDYVLAIKISLAFGAVALIGGTIQEMIQGKKELL